MSKTHGNAKSSQSKRPAARRAAEWVSLGISVALILGVAGLLVWDGLRGEPPLVPSAAVPQLDRAARAGERFVLPILVTNRGHQTMRDLKISIKYVAPDGQREQQDIVLDYLGEKSEQTIYAYFDHDPRTLDVKVRPVQYRLE